MGDKYFEASLAAHPSMQPQDMIKFCFQATFGAEHLLTDRKRAYTYFLQEYEETQPRDIPLYEELSPLYSRVNLSSWKMAGFSPEKLFEAFYKTASEHTGSEGEFLEKLSDIEASVAERRSAEASENGHGEAEALLTGLKEYVADYLRTGIQAVHHSEVYRTAEKPAYRVVRTELVRELMNSIL